LSSIPHSALRTPHSTDGLWAILVKEFLHVRRDTTSLIIMFIIPVIQTMVFGYAVTTDVNNIPTAVYDLDRSYESRELVRRLVASGYFKIMNYVSSPTEAQELLDRGKVTMALQINRGFSEDLKRLTPASLQILVDGTDSNTATVAMDYANRVIAQFSKDLLKKNPPFLPLIKGGEEGFGMPGVTIDLRARAWYNPELRSKNFNVPGVIATVIMLTSLLLTSMAVVREREIGTMEQLMVTPLKPLELILGKTIPFAVIAFFDMALITTLGVLKFDIPIRGPILLLPISTAIYLLSVLGIGLFVSTIARTQQQAMMATFLFFMPAILLSGFVFPIENMPLIFQYVTYINPLRYFLVIIRGLFLKGNGVAVLWPNMLSLLVLGLVVLTLSSLRFRKRLE
jgi:ABC-2 type transport system permease protein